MSHLSWHRLPGMLLREGHPPLPWEEHLPMLEGSAHKPLALPEDEGSGVGHTLQGFTHPSHYNAHEVASAVAQQVVDGWLTHGAHT